MYINNDSIKLMTDTPRRIISTVLRRSINHTRRCVTRALYKKKLYYTYYVNMVETYLFGLMCIIRRVWCLSNWACKHVGFFLLIYFLSRLSSTADVILKCIESWITTKPTRDVIPFIIAMNNDDIIIFWPCHHTMDDRIRCYSFLLA